MSKWTYLTRAVPNIGYLLQPFEDTIRQKFLTSLTGQNSFNDVTRELMALPVQLGGLGITNPSTDASSQYESSMMIAAPLTALIMEQSQEYSSTAKAEQIHIKKESAKIRRHIQSEAATELKDKVPNDMRRAMSLSAEKGGSSWLSTFPIVEHAFILHKSTFRDALCLRYGSCPSGLPLQCSCGKQFTVEHALSCSHGGYPSICHNELRDITAELMSKVCHNVGIEPSLQPVTDKHLVHRTANREDGAQLDVAAESFWGSNRQHAFFDIRVFNLFAPTYRNTPLAQCCRRNEMEKKRAYDQRIREIEHGSFSPLVFSTTGSMGMTATVVYKRLASLIAEKPYSKTMQWIQCSLSYSDCCAQPSCVCMDPGPHDTTLHIIKSLEIPLTLPAQWAGFKARTEHSNLYAVYIFCSLRL